MPTRRGPSRAPTWRGVGLCRARHSNPVVDPEAPADLALARLDGTVVAANHADYDRLRRVYNAAVERNPRAIVQAATPSDVQKVVTIAVDSGLPLAIRGGGHSFAGLGTCDDGIVCNLSPMNEVHVDPRAS